mgnify:CR=1 FL=1
MPSKIITAAAAAVLLGITPGGVTHAVKRGDLKRVFLAGENKRTSRNCYLLRSDVLAWRRARAKRVQPQRKGK